MGCTPPPGTQCPNAHVYRDRGWFQGQKCLLQAGLAGMSVLCPCPVLPLKTEQDRQPSSHSWNSLNAGGRSPDCLRGGCGPAHPGGRGRGPVEAIALHTCGPVGLGSFLQSCTLTPHSRLQKRRPWAAREARYTVGMGRWGGASKHGQLHRPQPVGTGPTHHIRVAPLH